MCREAKIPGIYAPLVIDGTQISQFLCLSAGIILFPKVTSRKEPKCLNNQLANIPFTDSLPVKSPLLTSISLGSPLRQTIPLKKREKVGLWLNPHVGSSQLSVPSFRSQVQQSRDLIHVVTQSPTSSWQEPHSSCANNTQDLRGLLGPSLTATGTQMERCGLGAGSGWAALGRWVGGSALLQDAPLICSCLPCTPDGFSAEKLQPRP